MDEMEIIEFENLPSNKTPLDADNLNKIQQNAKKAIKNRKPTIELLTVSSTAPTECNIGDKYYNTITSKIYTAIATNMWATTGENPSNLYLYVDLEHKELYYYSGTTFVSYGGGSGGTGGDTLPIGAILPFSSDTIPNGWLLCDGSSFSTTSYPELFEIIGTTYGYDDERNPKLPDLRGRVAVGKKAATSSSDTDFNELGKIGGEKTHTLTVNEMPSHKHELIVNKQQGGVNAAFQPTWGTAFSSTDSNSVLTTGGDQPHNNLQPYIVQNYIIKAKQTVAIQGEIIQENGTASTTNVYSSKAVDNKIENSIKTNIITGQEFATGRIIDGKKEFGKKFTYENISGVKNYDFDATNISEFTHMEGFCTTSTGGKYPLFSFNPYATGTGLEPVSSTLFCAWIEGSNLVVLAKKTTLTKATIYIYYTKNT